MIMVTSPYTCPLLPVLLLFLSPLSISIKTEEELLGTVQPPHPVIADYEAFERRLAEVVDYDVAQIRKVNDWGTHHQVTRAFCDSRAPSAATATTVRNAGSSTAGTRRRSSPTRATGERAGHGGRGLAADIRESTGNGCSFGEYNAVLDHLHKASFNLFDPGRAVALARDVLRWRRPMYGGGGGSSGGSGGSSGGSDDDDGAAPTLATLAGAAGAAGAATVAGAADTSAVEGAVGGVHADGDGGDTPLPSPPRRNHRRENTARTHAPVRTCRRIHRPTQEQFLGFVARNEPVIITGVAKRWAARKRWTWKYVVEYMTLTCRTTPSTALSYYSS